MHIVWAVWIFMKYAAYVLHLFVLQLVGKEGGSKISHLRFHLRKQENEAQIRSKVSRRKDNKKNRKGLGKLSQKREFPGLQ